MNNSFRITLLIALIPTLYSVTGCRESLDDSPPEVIVGDSVCAECGMILSDSRFATAIQTQDPRGKHTLLFDDSICQVRFEHKYPEQTVLRHWSMSFDSESWFTSNDGFFVYADSILSPMDSHTVAFSSIESARTYSEDVGGEVLTFQQITERLHESPHP